MDVRGVGSLLEREAVVGGRAGAGVETFAAGAGAGVGLEVFEARLHALI